MLVDIGRYNIEIAESRLVEKIRCRATTDRLRLGDSSKEVFLARSKSCLNAFVKARNDDIRRRSFVIMGAWMKEAISDEAVQMRKIVKDQM